jgi:hypothetical protein
MTHVLTLLVVGMSISVILLSVVMHSVVGRSSVSVAANRRIQRSAASVAAGKVAACFSQPKGEEYTGQILGVSCTCTLNRGGQYASLELWGLPIGGRLSGTAFFAKDGKTVVLESQLANAIARRGARVHEAHHEPSKDTVTVLLSIPLFGQRHIVLHRTQS